MEHTKFEYQQLNTPRGYDYTLIEWLNKLGQDGWEMCSYDNGLFIFKRQIITLLS